MIRLTNKPQHQQEIVYVDRPVIQHVEIPAPETKAPDAIVQYVDREVIKEIPVEKVVVQKEMEQVDLSPIHNHLQRHEDHLGNLTQFCKAAQTELEMQRRALVGLKTQRDIDRNRKLLLIRRLKKEKAAHKSHSLKLKLAIGACLLLSIVSLVVKL